MKRQRTAHGARARAQHTPHPAPKATGVNKVKGAIRQTKRLLAKVRAPLTQDSITPGARIEAERRLVALQRELDEKEQAGKERNLASRYHKVKFFGTSYAHAERQKIHRRIRQLSRAVREHPKDKAARAALHEARVLLHYVMVR